MHCRGHILDQDQLRITHPLAKIFSRMYMLVLAAKTRTLHAMTVVVHGSTDVNKTFMIDVP